MSVDLIAARAVAEELLRDFRTTPLLKDRPVRRDLTCVNVEPPAKAAFDALQDLFSTRAGRRLTQWEAFAVIVALTEEAYAYEVGAMRGR